MKAWYEKFGWLNDPFSTRPNKKLVGFTKEKNQILNYVYSGAITLITGPTGCGKTSVLLWLEKYLQKSHYTPIRINCVEKLTKNEIYTDIKHFRTVKDRLLLKKFPKRSVLLLDEAQYLQKDLGELIKVWWDDEKIYAILLASIKEPLNNLTGSFMDRFRGQIIFLPFLTSDQISQLITLRAGKIQPFDSSAIETIVTHAERIPRRALEICRSACMACAERNIFKINEKHISAFIPLIKEIKTVSPMIEAVERQKTETKKTIPSPKRQKTETKKTVVPTKRQALSLSPAQYKITKLLRKEELNAEQLAALLKTSIGSIRKQLSRLKRKGVITIADFTKSPVTYGLTDSFMRESVQE